MDWTRIVYLVAAGLMLILSARTMFLLRKTRRLLGETTSVWEMVKGQPEVIPCYECKYYEEGVLFCPQSDMRMKDGLIFCCYGERKEVSDEG